MAQSLGCSPFPIGFNLAREIRYAQPTDVFFWCPGCIDCHL